MADAEPAGPFEQRQSELAPLVRELDRVASAADRFCPGGVRRFMNILRDLDDEEEATP